MLQAEGLSPGLSLQASLPRVTRPKCAADSWGCFLLWVRDKRTRRRLQAPGQVFAFHRQAGMLEDCQGTATVLLHGGTGTERPSPGYRTLMRCSHTLGTRPGCRCSVRTQ